MRYKTLFTVLFAVVALTVAGCHGDNSASTEEGIESGTDTEASSIPIFSSFSQLPNATGRMAAATSGDASAGLAKSIDFDIGVFEVVSLSSVGNLAACEALNMLKGGFGIGANLDVALCYLKFMQADGYFASADLEDGNWHVIEIDTGDPEVATLLARLQVTKDENDAIESLELFTCIEIDPGTFAQHSYVKQEMSGADFSERAIAQMDNFDPGETPAMYEATIEGVLDASGAFLNKTIDASHNTEWEDEALWADVTLVQEPGTFKVSGARVQRIVGDVFGSEVVGAGALSGDTLSGVSAIAMGDGSGSYTQYDQVGAIVSEGIDSWQGADLSSVDPASDGAHYGELALVDATSIPSPPPDIAFTGDKAWSCEDDVAVGIETFAIPDAEVLNAACSQYIAEVSMFECTDQSIASCSRDVDMCEQNISDGFEEACSPCFPDGEADANTLECLLSLCVGAEEESCIFGITLACSPYEERCVSELCANFVPFEAGCLACFPKDNPDGDTLGCLMDFCAPLGEAAELCQVMANFSCAPDAN